MDEVNHDRRFIERAWDDVTEGLGLTWYQATRHSFTSRNLAAGASLDEVSAALGHSSPVVTRRYYDHFVRRSFSPGLRAGLGLAPNEGAEVIPMRSRQAPPQTCGRKTRAT